MLTKTINDFLQYCNTCHFAESSKLIFKKMLLDFKDFITIKELNNIEVINYKILSDFVTNKNPSVHIKKQRIWSLHKFFHYLTLSGAIPKNIAMQFPYPKMDKKEPAFFTVLELEMIIEYFINKLNSQNGLRNLIIVLLLSLLGLRLSSVVNINIQDHFCPVFLNFQDMPCSTTPGMPDEAAQLHST